MTLAETSLAASRLITDWERFAGYPASVQKDLLRKLKWIALIRPARNGHKQQLKTQAAADLGKSLGAINRYLGWYKDGGWESLIDERHAGVGSKGLPEPFKSYVAGVFDSLQRNDDGREAHRQLIDRWQCWRQSGNPEFKIPGYPAPPPPDKTTGEPKGWSYDNLLKLRPKKAARAAAKQGPKAASIYLPPVLTTRIGSAVLSRVLFDDQDLDNLLADGHLAISGITTAQKPVSFNSLDFYTAAHLDQHLRAQYKDPGTGKDKTLSGIEFAWFTIHHLQTRGYRTDHLGTELIQEHGTAKTWQNQSLTSLSGHHSFEDALHAITGGSCIINRSGKFDSPLFADMCFRPSSTGNFKFKTWLESAFRLLRTYMASLPGPTGSRERDNGRGETYGIRLAEKNLLTAIYQAVDPGTQEFLRANLRHELLDLPTFHQLILAVYRAVNARTRHELEGWSQCGFTIPLWRPSETSQHWFTQDELTSIPDPEEKRFLLKRINSNRDLLTRQDRLSPAMALQIELARDAKHITKLKDASIGLLLPTDWAIRKTIASNHTFTLPNPLWPDTQETYVASWDHNGAQVTLDAGKALLIYANPFSDGRAHLHDMNGSYITTLYPTVRAEPFRQDKTLAQLAVRSAVKSGHEAHLKARLTDIAAGRVATREHNKQILDLTREDRHRTANAAQDACTTAATTTHTTHSQAADHALSQITPTPDPTHTHDLDFETPHPQIAAHCTLLTLPP
jgi:hypothetical protein